MSVGFLIGSVSGNPLNSYLASFVWFANLVCAYIVFKNNNCGYNDQLQ